MRVIDLVEVRQPALHIGLDVRTGQRRQHTLHDEPHELVDRFEIVREQLGFSLACRAVFLAALPDLFAQRRACSFGQLLIARGQLDRFDVTPVYLREPRELIEEPFEIESLHRARRARLHELLQLLVLMCA